MVAVFKVGEADHVNNVELGCYGRNRSNVWHYAGVNSFKAGRQEELAFHPTVKPVALVADAIKDVTRRNAIILDLFGGSGTTLIAAERTGRRARLIEIEPRYVDVAIRRFQALTKADAIWSETREQRIEVNEGGRRRKLSKGRVAARQVVNKAASGDMKAFATATDLLRKTGQLAEAPTPHGQFLSADDLQAAADLLRFYAPARA